MERAGVTLGQAKANSVDGLSFVRVCVNLLTLRLRTPLIQLNEKKSMETWRTEYALEHMLPLDPGGMREEVRTL